MLATLQGKVAEISLGHFILEIGGVGYKLKVHGDILTKLTVGHEVKVYLHEHIREDAYDLYAFLSAEELDFFERLLGVSGVGPKVALAVCAAAPLDVLRARLMQGDADWLAAQPGIGKKTAQKIILELKGKLVEVGVAPESDRELVETLTGLGYTAFQAREAAKNVSPDVHGSAERLRAALKILSK